MTVEARWSNRIRQHLSKVSFTDYIYQNESLIATGKLSSDYPEHTAPEGTPFWTYVYDDKIAYWVHGVPPVVGYSSESLYQVIVHSDSTITRKVPTGGANAEMLEYDSSNNVIAREECYALSRSEMLSTFSLPILDSDENVFRWTVRYENDTPVSMIAYVEG